MVKRFDSVVKRFSGIMPFVPTPFMAGSDPGTTLLNEEGLRENLRFLAKYDFQVIFPCAGTGELFAISETEYKRVLEIAMQEIGDDALVIPGLPTEIEGAINAARYAQKLGCQCVLAFPPNTLGGVSEKGIYNYWEAIANSVDIGIMVFRAPWLPFSLDLLEKLVKIPNIISVKEETHDFGWYQRAYQRLNGKTTFVGGGELFLAYYLMSGVKGVTTGLPNFMPEPFIEMHSAAESNDFAQVMRIYQKLQPLLAFRQKPGNAIPVVKRGMDLVGLTGGPNRLPQVPLSDEDDDELRKHLITLGIIE